MRENVILEDGSSLSLPSYIQRVNIQLLKVADFNQKRESAVQKICRLSKDESEVRNTLENIWKAPDTGDGLLVSAVNMNKSLYEFEKMLEAKFNEA